MKKTLLLVATLIMSAAAIAQNNLVLQPVGDGVSVTVSAAKIIDGNEVSSGDEARLSADGNTGTRWGSSGSGTGAWFQVQWSAEQTFNTVKLLCENAMSAAFGAADTGFDIQTSNDGTNWDTQKSLMNEYAGEGQYITVIFDDAVTASYVRFVGTGTPPTWGYSFYEFEVYNNDYSAIVLTSVEISAASPICKIGETLTLTAIAKDQYDNVIEGQEVSFSVSPADAGSVVNGVYTASKSGSATITVTSGDKSSNLEIYNYEGSNVALNKTVTGTGFNSTAYVNDGNDLTEYQADPDNGGAGHDVTCSFVVDLGAEYDLNLITILFEGACSDAYTIETSADNETFALAYSYSATNGINYHTDYIYGNSFENKEGVRYVKFQSTKNATDWGVKIFEIKIFAVDDEDSGDEGGEVLPEGTVTLVNGDNTVYVTPLKDGKGNYQLIIKGSNLNGLGGSFWRINGEGSDMRSSITSSTNSKMVITVKSSSEPEIYTPLYVMMPGEVNFGSLELDWILVSELDGVEYGEDNEDGDGEDDNDETPTRESQLTGEIKHFAPEDAVVRATYQITADAEGNVTFNVLGTEIKFVEIQILGKGNYAMTVAADESTASYTLNNVDVNTELYFRFLIQVGDMPGNEMTTSDPTVSETNPKTFYYVYTGATSSENDATGIKQISVAAGLANVYDITGKTIRVNVDANAAISGLAKGVYIVETQESVKKVVVRK